MVRQRNRRRPAWFNRDVPRPYTHQACQVCRESRDFKLLPNERDEHGRTLMVCTRCNCKRPQPAERAATRAPVTDGARPPKPQAARRRKRYEKYRSVEKAAQDRRAAQGRRVDRRQEELSGEVRVRRVDPEMLKRPADQE